MMIRRSITIGRRSTSSVLLAALFCALAGPPLLAAEDPREIILRSAALDQRDLELARNYVYVTRTEQRRLNSSGKTTSVESETHEVLILYGSPYRRLIAKDDKPLTADQALKEQAKIDKELERRRKASEKDREKLAREESKSREQQAAMIREVADAYSFRMLGEEDVDGYRTWAIQAEPIPGYHPRSSRARLLPSFRGKIWITQNDYRWVKVEAEAIRTVSFGLVLARLQPGTRVAFEQKRVQGEIWLPSSAHVKLSARLALLKKVNAEIDVTFSDYRKFRSDSRIIETTEAATVP
jgi:hypothetical protein